MDLMHIGVFAVLGLLYAFLMPAKARGWALMVGSLIAVYWLQPALPIRHLDFALPSLTIALCIWAWAVTTKDGWRRSDWIALGASLSVVIAISLTRYLIEDLRPTPSRPPAIATVLLGLAILSGLGILWDQLSRVARMVFGFQVLMIALFIVLKAPPLTEEASAILREMTGRSASLARASDLQWLGFSYIAFRILHVLRDGQVGNLPQTRLREHMTFMLFFPALTAGPIDRIERHIEDDRALDEMRGADPNRLTVGGMRIAVGILKKFVIADTLALIALNDANALQAGSMWDGWVLLYGYSLRLFFDFSGYTDIAIGIGILFGITLPENFDRPYLKPNITAFWQSWHITLSNWVRFYVFSPLTRKLLRRKPRPKPWQILLAGHYSTMVIIGLWHGITANFFIWGLWHATGLFLHKLWSDRTRKRYMKLNEQPRLKLAWNAIGILITFHFVSLGWVWFSLADFETAQDVFLKLLGVG